jgi:hypothetical protein
MPLVEWGSGKFDGSFRGDATFKGDSGKAAFVEPCGCRPTLSEC